VRRCNLGGDDLLMMMMVSSFADDYMPRRMHFNNKL